MPRFSEKVLWTVFMRNEAEEARLLSHAQSAGVTAVAVRTSNLRLAGAIERFHNRGIKVYGWRWPAKQQTTSPPNYYAIDQAHFIVSTLIPAGLDGFYADIESDGDSGANDWDNAALAPLATQFCEIIVNAASAGFEFSVSSGARQPTHNPNIPWASFSPFCNYVMPQAYWRWTGESGLAESINGGTPTTALAKAEVSWGNVFPDKPLIPIMGELDVVTAGEITSYADLIAAKGISQFHAYTDTAVVSEEKLATIAAL
jgi:hypothetical protein